MSSFPADRLRPKWQDGLIFIFILAAALLSTFALRPSPGNGLTAVVTLGTVEVGRQDLQALTQTLFLEVPDAPYPITVEFEPGRVRVAHTACPGGDCAGTGWVSRTGGQIVCLPNRLVVALIGEGSPEIDAVVG